MTRRFTRKGCASRYILRTLLYMAVHPSTSGGQVAEGPLLLDLVGAASALSVSRTKLYGLMRNDAFPSVVIGGRRYVAHADLVAYVDRLRADAQPYSETAS